MFYNSYCLTTVQDELETIKKIAKGKLVTWKYSVCVCVHKTLV